MITAIDLFSGAGGFALGMEQAGIRSVLQCEIDPTALSVLRRHWPDVPKHEDIRTLDARPYRGKVDIVFGGSPCQDLSVAGKRAGLSGSQSSLWWEMIRVVEECQPALVVWENVPGALSSHSGRDFAIILHSLADLGAVDISYRILDARYWGVPQRRRRVFLVVDFRGERAGEILFEPESGSGHPSAGRTAREDVANPFDGGPAYSLRAGRRISDAHGNEGNDVPFVADTLGGGSGSRGWASDVDRMTFIAAPLTHAPHQDRRDLGVNLLVAPVDLVNVTSQVNRTRVEYGSPANTLHPGGQSVIGPTIGVRRLLPIEAERLQGWPDNWTAFTDTGVPISDSQRYKLCGNGVVAPVARWIGERIVTALEPHLKEGS